jgi:hypothetical protein
MPIQRFGSTLISKGSSTPTWTCSREASSRTQNLAGVMCRSLVSVDWQGWLYDCDFNQQLGPAAGHQRRAPPPARPAQDRSCRRSRSACPATATAAPRAGQQLRRCAGALSGRARRSHGDDAARARVVAGHRHAVLNEAAGIEAALRALAPLRARGAGGGGRWRQRRRHAGARAALRRRRGDSGAARARAAQMNAGALAATGDGVLLFLHADTTLPPDADRLIAQALAGVNRSGAASTCASPAGPGCCAWWRPA